MFIEGSLPVPVFVFGTRANAVGYARRSWGARAENKRLVRRGLACINMAPLKGFALQDKASQASGWSTASCFSRVPAPGDGRTPKPQALAGQQPPLLAFGAHLKEIVRIRSLPQLVGWRHYPGAHGKRPWACECCQKGQYGSRKIREKYADKAA